MQLSNELENSEKRVIEYLAKMANFILEHSSKDEIIECHLFEPERKNIIIQKLTDLSKSIKA